MMDSSRRLIYWILIVTAVAAPAGRLLSNQLLFEPSLFREPNDPKDVRKIWPAARPQPMPTFGSNDRSRWATVRSLVDDGTFVIGKRDTHMILATSVLPLGQLDSLQALAVSRLGFEYRTKRSDSGIIFQPGWESIDKVLHPATFDYYSSKPPLLSTLVAGLYWLLKMLFGWTLDSHPWAVVRTILFLVNIFPFAIYLGSFARLVERYGTTDWGRCFVLAAAGFGTMVTPFQITFNNHTVASYCVLFALVCVLDIWKQGRVAGVEALQSSGGPRVRGFEDSAPATQPRWQPFVGAGLFSAFAVCNELPALAFAAALFLVLLAYYPGRTLLLFLPGALALGVAFFAVNHAAIGQLRPAYSELESPWYQFEGSHWRRPNEGEIRPGIDFARYKESRLQYAFHVLAGHHGWFSLTPIWILALWGMISACRKPSGGLPRFLAPIVLGVSAVVIGFYLVKSDNYGGWTSGPRWLMWLSPLWLVCLLPVADRLSQTRRGRFLALSCLVVSVVSVHYSPWNPWRHPWIYDLMMACGWQGY
ncbi:MAG: hypothetical protein HY040_24580 [Planctomycetes bacterium]|nr:hypothetical protein [Planctomycetota bacterium]